jgi:hypothetical protein
VLKRLKFLTIVIVALPTATAVAHALELPGKLRLDERTYRAVQRMYYPGFTLGGYAEPLAIAATPPTTPPQASCAVEDVGWRAAPVPSTLRGRASTSV